MFYLLYEWFLTPNILRYQTFRSICAVFTSFFISFIFGNYIIKWLKSFQKEGQPIREDGPASHLVTKKGIPTMGGLLILFSVSISTLLWANLKNPFVWICLLSMISFGYIGFIDDWQKLTSSKGIFVRSKLRIQFFFAFLISFLIAYFMGFKDFSMLRFPFFKNVCIPLSFFAYLWSSLVIVGSSNAVNLTDGLDGLAIFPVMIASLTLGIIAYLVGHVAFANYLFIPHNPFANELSVFLAGWVGASLGFLWFNAPPAKVFMGDIGSLSSGAVLGTIAVMIKHEIIWAIIGGVFVIETVSVIIQVAYFKATRKRVFLMAPIHHHFEQKGWGEPTIVIRFWIISVLLALLALSSLKLR